MKNAREAWELDRDYNMIPIDRSLLNKVCSKLAITTLFWNAFRNVFHFETHSARYKDFLKRADAFKIDHPDANDRIPIIEKLCIDNDSKFVLSVIPSLKGDGRILKYAGDDKRLFPAQSFFEDKELIESDYCANGDTHFNDRGHLKYAAYLQKIIDSLSAQQ